VPARGTEGPARNNEGDKTPLGNGPADFDTPRRERQTLVSSLALSGGTAVNRRRHVLDASDKYAAFERGSRSQAGLRPVAGRSQAGLPAVSSRFRKGSDIGAAEPATTA
jgi:hypothetical protein